ncbi:unnamed protein product [Thelazia callipaeda]|uniref:ShKT domain-containing protein n=1 Tax=Thelazia callipaeda TaxID=103827 RepID=A0A0N5CJV0_THECL|nr:unnamed protein product [Thelazia callipaeda]
MEVILLSIALVFLECSRADVAQELPNPCADAPTESAQIVCEQLHKWDKEARAKSPVGSLAPLPPAIAGKIQMVAAELSPISSTPYQCLDLECLCIYFRGRVQPGGVCYLPDGSRLTKAIRKEYRMLTDQERNRFHNALKKLKSSGEFENMALIHGRAAVSGGAHSGPAFLPWHREFLKRFEIALRQIDPTVALPYWDSVLDSGLPNPSDSILWTDEFMGSTNEEGAVTGGNFANFVTFQKHPHIKREVGKQGSPFKQSEIDWLLQQNQIETVLSFTAPRQGCQYRANYNALEYTHGNVHIFVGGDMYDPYTSGNDPSFYLHHSFVDYIWEMYRQEKQTRYQRENDYPLDNQACSSALHFGSALMRPFTPLRNIEGLSNKYIDNMYEYASRPTCQSGQNCGSKYLFCDLSHGRPHCVSQVRSGGRCDGFINGESVCHEGVCVNGRCVPIETTNTKPVTSLAPIAAPTTRAPTISVQTNCFNEHECCQVWAQQGECNRNANYMREWCKVSCRICLPSFNGTEECSNHHQNCDLWARTNECTKNPRWMSENCRRSCGRCGRTRVEVCTGGRQATATTPLPTVTSRTAAMTTTRTTTATRPRDRPHPHRPNLLHCNSPGCYNENVCCPLWSLQGYCSRNATWMACNCKVSCGLCISSEYDYGTCNDYHRSCPIWAMQGECQRNAWMLENCRRSCRSCFDQLQLRMRCRSSFSMIRFVPSNFDYYYYDIL